MPAAAAHYQFGQLVLHQCAPHIAEKIQKSKEMFDLGTQGPDILFFYRPYGKNPVSQLGHKLHCKEGNYLFLPLLPEREHWSEALTAYLLGLCCHYSLDRTTHPLIMELAPSTIEHQAIEAALDRLIYDQYAISIPRQKMIPTRVDISALQTVYSQLTRGYLREAAASLHHYNLLLEHPKVVRFAEGIVGKRGKFSEMCLPTTVGDNAPARQILPLYESAIPDALHLISVLLDGNTTDDTLLREMKLNYEGAIR